MFRKSLRLIILIISVLTVIAGAVQVINPGFVLSAIQGEASPTAVQLFATIGLFMFLFGGLMIHSLYSAYPDKVVVFWSGLQKAGAAIAVFIGISKGLFSSTAALVAGFDLLSALLFFIYLTNKKRKESKIKKALFFLSLHDFFI